MFQGWRRGCGAMGHPPQNRSVAADLFGQDERCFPMAEARPDPNQRISSAKRWNDGK